MPAAARFSRDSHDWFEDSTQREILRSELRTEFNIELDKLRGEMLKRHCEALQITFFVFWSGSMVALAALSIWLRT